ncbi:glycosyltransferase, partial [Candidatus Gottesmanbacteria bacterium]|nr:glycosyltransferase [Candidatus Gottesmanbacteria bacterium]
SKTQCHLSFGGYIALPVALAGWLLRIPIITHEQSVVPGLATKIISRIAYRVCVSWPQSLGFFPKEKTRLTGNPIRLAIFNFQFSIFNKIPISQFPNKKLPLIYITGGNLGAHAINEVVANILPRLLEKYRIIHQCGDSQIYRDYGQLSVVSCQLSVEQRKRYLLTKYVESEDIGWVLNNADLVISRAGANTVTELAALAKPAIFIPLPWAGQQEQLANASLLEKIGSAVILPQEKLTGQSLYQCIESLIQNIDKYKENSKKAQKLVDLKAADKLVEVINEAKKQTNSS